MSLEPRQLNDLDEWLLDELARNRSTPKLLRGRLQKVRDADDVPSAGYINQRLRRLEEHDHLENLDETGVYELRNDPRGDAADTDDVATLREQLDELRDERDDLQAALEDCRDELAAADGVDPDVVADARQAAARALAELPDDVPGRTAVEDVARVLEGSDDA